MIHKILCPIDFSNHSKAGLSSAIALAESKNAEFVLFHVTSFPFHDFPTFHEGELLFGTRYAPRFTVDGLIRDAEVKIGSFFATHFGNKVHEIKWKPKVGLGKVSSEIVDAACREEADLIVMGKRKRNAVQRFLFQSISEAVSDCAPCPVLTVCAAGDADSESSGGSMIRVWGQPELHGYS